MRLLHLLLELLFPRKCVLCGSMLSREETDLCRDCRCSTAECNASGIDHPCLDGVASVWYYESNVRESLLRYKFSGARHYARAYARLLSMKLLRAFPDAELVTWVPVSPLRRMKRGYDQSELLARAVGAELGLPVVKLLKKTRHNPAQSGMDDPEKRAANVRNVYGIRKTDAHWDKAVILVDDILTTGATAGECARVLRNSGAERVYLGIMARRRTKQS